MIVDELLSEVFTNLIGITVKFGGTGVTVADNGPNIPDDQKVHVFERFVRNTRRVSGKGLGFWITKMLVERYGGSIVAGSLGEGVARVVVLRKAEAMGNNL